MSLNALSLYPVFELLFAFLLLLYVHFQFLYILFINICRPMTLYMSKMSANLPQLSSPSPHHSNKVYLFMVAGPQ
jgi:hypothetical protein